jgi:hypothetical protein
LPEELRANFLGLMLGAMTRIVAPFCVAEMNGRLENKSLKNIYVEMNVVRGDRCDSRKTTVDCS